MKKNIFISLLLTVSLGIVFDSCKKPETDTETQSATDNAICEAEFTAIMPSTNARAVKQVGINGNKLAAGAGPYVVIDSSINGQKWPRRMHIDFDRDPTGTVTGGFTDADGRFRKGILSMLFDTTWVTAKNPRVTIDTMKNYSVNGITYKARAIIISKTSNSYSTTVEDGSCTNSSWTLKWSGTRTFTIFNSGKSNEEVHVTGSANGTNRDNVSYSTNITSPLVKSTACTYISSGVIDITPSGKAVRTIDYSVDAAGNHKSACDNAVALVIKGNTFIFKID